MGKLMKYELMRSKYWFLITAASVLLAQGLIVYGNAAKNLDFMNTGLGLFMSFGFFGVFALMAFAVWVFSSDISKKHGYMVFLTPRSAFQILGSKLLITLVALVLGFAAYMALAIYNLGLVTEESGIFTMIASYVPKNAIPSVILVIFDILMTCFVTIVTVYFSIALSHTLLEKLRFKGLLTVIIFLAITWGLGRLNGLMLSGEYVEAIFKAETSVSMMNLVEGIGLKVWILSIAANLVVGAALYALSAWLVEKKLSL